MSLLAQSGLLRLLVGRKWQNFIGLSYEETQSTIRSVVDDLNWEYTDSEESSSFGDRFMLGGDATTFFEFEEQGFTVECVSASYDPVQRSILGLVVREETKQKYRDSTTIIRISPITSQTEPEIATFLTKLVESIDKEPWEIVHPRFNLSPVLKYKTRVFWEYWQTDAHRNRDKPT